VYRDEKPSKPIAAPSNAIGIPPAGNHNHPGIANPINIPDANTADAAVSRHTPSPIVSFAIASEFRQRPVPSGVFAEPAANGEPWRISPPNGASDSVENTLGDESDDDGTTIMGELLVCQLAFLR